MSKLLNEIIRNTNIDLEFISIGHNLFDSEEMTDAAYTAYLAMLATHFQQDRDGSENIRDIGNLFLNGAYLPCCQRITFAQDTDVIPTARSSRYYLSLPDEPNDTPQFRATQPVSQFPRGIATLSRGGKFKHINISSSEGSLIAQTQYFSIKKNGIIEPALYEGPTSGNTAKFNARSAIIPSVTIGALADSAHLWSATVTEPTIGSHETPLALGLEKEQVKSLFYARNLPITETGRKRPILHLVRAHQRRIKEGVDIDISRHIRGVDTVTIGGMDFAIRPPEITGDLWRRWLPANSDRSGDKS